MTLQATAVNWMQFIDDSVSLTAITIPGTHDTQSTAENLNSVGFTVPEKGVVSRWVDTNLPGATDVPVFGWVLKGGTRYVDTCISVGFPIWAECQNVDFETQLQWGVRYLDIRLGEPDFSVRHGECKLGGPNLDSILSSVSSYLMENRRETVLISILWDDPEHACPRVALNAKVLAFWNSCMWWKENEWPTLGQVRGKAVLLPRFPREGNDLVGIDWVDVYGDASHLDTDRKWAQQDNGKDDKLEHHERWRRGMEHLKVARNADIANKVMYFTGFADWALDRSSKAYADYTNPKLHELLGRKDFSLDPRRQRLGTIICNFMTDSLAHKILSMNWPKQIYSLSDRHTWIANREETITSFDNGVKIKFQKAGEVVVFAGDGSTLWQSHTGLYSGGWDQVIADLEWGNGVLTIRDNSVRAWAGCLHSGGTYSCRLVFSSGPPFITVQKFDADGVVEEVSAFNAGFLRMLHPA